MRHSLLAVRRPDAARLTCHLALLCGALAIASPTAAVPSASHALHMSPAQVQWFAAGYQLCAGPLQLGAGGLADRLGPRRVLLGALAVFAAGSFLATVAVHAPWLIAARLLQGTGGAALSPISLALLLGLHSATGHEDRAVAGWVSTAAVASCIGPLLGGSLTSLLGWRGVFGALAVLAALTACRARSLPAPHPDPKAPMPLDALGIALCTGAGTAILITFTAATARSAAFATAAALSSAVLLALLVRQTRRHPHPALDAGLLRRAPARRALLALFTLFTANSAFHFLAYFHLSRAHALSPVQATLVALPAVLPAVLAGRLAVARSAHHRGPALMRAGLLCVTAGLLAATAGCRRPTPLWLLSGGYVLVGCGLGLANGAAMTTVARHRAAHLTSRATATATTFAMLGGASGPVAAGAALAIAAHLPFGRGAPSGDLPAAALTAGASGGIQQGVTVGVHASLVLLALGTAAAAFALGRRARLDR
ncbi:MFS transporter [Streptomyces syringium]|uniref:MFS transporter n=1 Tax=Streptomyces syringium TaxID=76729 RepID=UPI0037D711A3